MTAAYRKENEELVRQALERLDAAVKELQQSLQSTTDDDEFDCLTDSALESADSVVQLLEKIK